MKTKFFTAVVTALFILLSGFQACKKQAFFAAVDAEIQLSASSLSIGLNESIVITIVGFNSDGSYLWDGTRIDLTIQNGTLDRNFIELEDGSATVVATGNVARGEMIITARSGSIFASPNPLSITVGDIAAVDLILISTNPASLPYTGGLMQITATVYDEFFDPIPDVRVIFETDAGTLNSRGRALTTNALGQVTDSLQTTTDANITIHAGDNTNSLSVILGREPDPNFLPIAEFIYSPQDPINGETVYFNASTSYDDDGAIVRYDWDFGDGTRRSGKTPQHSFDVSQFLVKTFTILLTVTDNDGGQASVTRDITVTLK
ncbi:MAG: PKD domain-containing protein [bacterium]|nr:PKD domain-containing protein [bacterium]